MVVLSVALLNRAGKGLVARQFVEMSRMRLEGLLTAFPKLLGGASRQHTFIDTENVRYVYQPLDNYYILLITNKTSNIVADLQTLQLVSKVVPDVVGHLTDEGIQAKQFEIVFAFDEILNAGGHVENVSLQQIRTNMEMESHEEKLHMMIVQSKRAAAKSEMKRQQQRIKVEQRDRVRMERATGIPSSSHGSGGFSNSSYSSGAAAPAPSMPPPPKEAPPSMAKSTGMKLGGAKKGKSFLDAMTAEDDLTDLPPMSTAINSSLAPPVAISSDPIVVSMEETISVQLNRDGAFEQLEVKGSLYVNANDASSASCRLRTAYSNECGISFQCHPKVDKKLFENESILGLKDKSKSFPESRVGVLRWSMKTQDEDMLPLNLTCWPEDEGDGKFTVTLEYDVQRPMDLSDVNITIPLGTSDIPKITSIDGEYRHNPSNGCLLWHLDSVNESNSSGSLEFSVRGHDMEDFFPINLAFFSKTCYADLTIQNVHTNDSNDEVKFSFSKLLSTGAYSVQ